MELECVPWFRFTSTTSDDRFPDRSNLAAFRLDHVTWAETVPGESCLYVKLVDGRKLYINGHDAGRLDSLLGLHLLPAESAAFAAVEP